MNKQIHYWAHMLDESQHMSYYDLYMREHPDDRLRILVDRLLEEFADSLELDHVDLKDCDFIDCQSSKFNSIASKIKTKYYWEKIKSQTYAAIISRLTALLNRSKNQRFNENEIGYDDVSHLVSRKTIEICLNIICHNTNVLEANNSMLLDAYKGSPMYGDLFEKHGIPALYRHDLLHKRDAKDYVIATQFYKVWAAYAKGNAGEKYVCDSDNGPEQLKKILSNVEYSADTIDLIVALNRALDVVHFRSDLAAAFIEGGQQTCALVSNLPDKFVV